MRAPAAERLAERDQQVNARLCLFLLGGFRAESEGQPIPDRAWQRAKAKALVKLLAVQPDHRLHREQLLDLLWPDLDPGSADDSLRRALYLARHALEPDLPPRGRSSYLIVHGEVVELSSTAVWIDADQFEARAKDALASADIAACEETLRAYTGELLPEDRYEDWAASRRETLADLQVRLLMRLAELHEARGQNRAAVERLEQVIDQDPAREEAHRRLMRLYALSDSRHQALRQYQALRASLQAELGVEPEAETEALYEEIVSGRLAKAAPLLPAAVRRPPATPFVGRERALDLLLADLENATRGTGGMVLISGEAGVGKSRLAAELVREAQRRGALVLWGASYAQEGLLPYGPFVEALDGYAGDLSPTARQAMAAEYPQLAPLLPSLTADAEPELPTGGDRTRLFATMVRWLAHLSSSRPVLLVLDDLHAADVESLHLLHHLARRAPEQRWLLTGTYREGEIEVGGEFQQLFAAATLQGIVRRVELLRLTRHEADRLVQSLLPGGVVAPELLEGLYAHSLGNPLYIQELVGALRGRGGLGLADGAWRASDLMPAGVPSEIRTLVEARVDRMDENTRRALNLAAVVGMEVAYEDLRAAAEGTLDEAALLDALDRALHSQFLEERGGGYTFCHPMYRAAIYERLSSRRRVHLHAALAAAIERHRPNDVESLAYHYAQTDRQRKAFEYLERAGDRARSLYANQAAASYYRAARERLERMGAADADLSRVDEKLGDVHLLTGEFAEAELDFRRSRESETDLARRVELWRKEGSTWEKRGEYERALAAFQAAEDEVCAQEVARPAAALGRLRAELALSRGLVYHRQGDDRRTEAAAEHALALLGEDQESEGTANAANLLAMAAWRHGDLARAEAFLRRSLAVGERLGNRSGLATCYNNLGQVAVGQGNYAQAEECHHRALAIYQLMGDQFGVAMSWNNLGVAAFERGDYVQAEECYRRSLAIREPMGDQGGLAVCWANLGEVAQHRGDLVAAEERYNRSLTLYVRIGDQYGIAYLHYNLGRFTHLRGRLEQAEEHYGQSLAIWKQIGHQRGAAESLTALGELLLEGGEVEMALQLCRRARRLAHRIGAPEPEAWAAVGQARAHVRAGQRRHAACLIEHARSLAASHDLAPAAVHSGLLLAELRLLEERPSEARGAIEEVLGLVRDRRMRLEEAIALRLRGQSALAIGNRGAGEADLRTSQGTLEAIGAELELARTRAVLEALQSSAHHAE